ncbi:hypothetical protein M427DRAFT_147581 [Gonapodya prolifera JEL478]|uniref:Uncharacterized protein n=1 Tax=Gonapodya prolifera (strain JEL478) TaxID=1344416 RepID=A0A139A5N2_GONPJ|nr:hypothetical protein M427DRAFT_147581 [Gonapodya prolifera JEL478]|eukprot:KXS11713.1 hypothetical protein M427DRAFT_147581 [Gonapodya prolifera JEL478]
MSFEIVFASSCDIQLCTMTAPSLSKAAIASFSEQVGGSDASVFFRLGGAFETELEERPGIAELGRKFRAKVWWCWSLNFYLEPSFDIIVQLQKQPVIANSSFKSVLVDKPAITSNLFIQHVEHVERLDHGKDCRSDGAYGRFDLSENNAPHLWANKRCSCRSSLGRERRGNAQDGLVQCLPKVNLVGAGLVPKLRARLRVWFSHFDVAKRAGGGRSSGGFGLCPGRNQPEQQRWDSRSGSFLKLNVYLSGVGAGAVAIISPPGGSGFQSGASKEGKTGPAAPNGPQWWAVILAVLARAKAWTPKMIVGCVITGRASDDPISTKSTYSCKMKPLSRYPLPRPRASAALAKQECSRIVSHAAWFRNEVGQPKCAGAATQMREGVVLWDIGRRSQQREQVVGCRRVVIRAQLTPLSLTFSATKSTPGPTHTAANCHSAGRPLKIPTLWFHHSSSG